MHQQSVAQLISGLRQKQFSSEELTRHYLARIEHLDTQYNSFIHVTEERALSDARRADQALARGEQPALTGVPMAHKDIFCTKDIQTTCGSKMLADFIPTYNATVVARCQQAGMVLLGKTNMDEFAMGSSNETSVYGPVNNPWDQNCVPGGSSGGSAAAVAAQLTPVATGTDTGGSIRQPAALCGVTGLKPTYGRVSRYGMIAFASSLDQGGLLARSAEDAAILLQAMAGFDAQDSTSAEQAVVDYPAKLNDSIQGLRIGVPKEYFADGLHAEVAQAIEAAVQVLEGLGATIKEVSLPHTDLSVACYYVLAPAEASSNLARFDGVRYGYRCEQPHDLADLYCRTRSEGFGDEVKRRLLIGAYTLSAGFYDAYYRQAQKVRRLIRQDFMDAWQDVDVIVGPTTPHPAFAQGSKTQDPLAMYLEDIYTIAVNLAGLPALSVPAGFVDNKPIGLQLIGQDWQEARLLTVAHHFQQATDWHQQSAASE